MLNLKSAPVRAVALAVALVTVATPALGQDRYDWGGGRSGERDHRLDGVGVPLLLPELKRTARGRAFVMRNFDHNRDGRINRREAEDANRAFLLVAGGRRDRFDWESRDVDRPNIDRPNIDRPVVGKRDWDRRGMRGYQMRQTRHGATFDLQDVLFETGSARLRPGAIERLRPLASYLGANPDVPVRIDGHTDSVGGDSANQLLSERRAESVRAALLTMGAQENDFLVAGHGETMPAATNGTATGRQLNRRVEVTLVGQQARSFSE